MFTVGTTNESDRVKWIEETLKKIPEGLTILDAGAGESQFKKFCSHLKYIAQDFGAIFRVMVKSDCKLAHGIIQNLILFPIFFPSHYLIIQLDAIMCTEVLEHIPDPIGAIKEFSRLVKPGGYLLITAPFASLTHFAPYHFASGSQSVFL